MQELDSRSGYPRRCITLKDKAAVKGVSVNAIILQILWEWLEHNAAGGR